MRLTDAFLHVFIVSLIHVSDWTTSVQAKNAPTNTPVTTKAPANKASSTQAASGGKSGDAEEEYNEAGVVVISGECVHASCIDHFKFKKYNRPPDMFVTVDYGENDKNGKYKKVGKLGQTDVVRNQHIADFGRTVIAYRKHERSHNFKVRAIGIFHIMLYDKDPGPHHELIGGTYFNVTDTGLHSSVEVGIGNLTFEIFHTDHCFKC